MSKLIVIAVGLIALGYPLADAQAQTSWEQQARLTTTDLASEARFGASLSLSGNSALVGAFLDGPDGPFSGSAAVFVRSESGWALQQKLVPSAGIPSGYAGFAVGLSGDSAVIGAPGTGFSNAPSAVYVFTRSGAAWTEQATLTETALTYGRAVAIDGDTLAIGDPDDTLQGFKQGAVYIYVRAGGSWSQQATLRASDGDGEALFGDALSLSGDVLAVGAWDDDSAYVFTRSNGSWQEQHKIIGPNMGNGFGRAVALSGDTLLIGDLSDGDGGVSAGAAYVYVSTGSTWTLQQKLVASTPAPYDAFGWRVALDGDNAAIGLIGATANPMSGGSVFVFQRQGSSWSETQELTVAGGSDVGFGEAVAIDGDVLLAGAPHDGDGAVYAYRMALDPLGIDCGADTDCESGFCVDGVCCDAACGAGDPTDCQACAGSVTGMPAGTCAPVVSGQPCRLAADSCDLEEVCDGSALMCPADATLGDATLGDDCGDDPPANDPPDDDPPADNDADPNDTHADSGCACGSAGGDGGRDGHGHAWIVGLALISLWRRRESCDLHGEHFLVERMNHPSSCKIR